MIAKVVRPTRIRNGKRVKGRILRGRIKLDGDAKERWVSLGTSDQRVADKRLREIVEREERERAGIAPPRALVDAASRPVVEHLAEYIEELRSLGRSRDYVRKPEHRIGELIADCGWKFLREVTPESFEAWRRGALNRLAAKTLNEYLAAARSFLAWLHDRERIASNPLSRVRRVGKAPSHERRAFALDELQRLLDASGPRRVVYLVAAKTGLRFNELRRLRWSDVHLDGCQGLDGRAAILLRAESTKAKRPDVLPLSGDVVEELRSIRPQSPGVDARVFAKGMPSHHTWAEDLRRAGIKASEVIDGLEVRVCFHSLRHTFATMLDGAGVTGRMKMALTRHTDPRLSEGVYTHVRSLSLAGAVDRLPVLRRGDDAQIDAHVWVTESRGASRGDTAADSDGASESAGNEGVFARNDADGHVVAEAVESMEPGGIEPPSRTVELPPLRV